MVVGLNELHICGRFLRKGKRNPEKKVRMFMKNVTLEKSFITALNEGNISKKTFLLEVICC